jgi:DNA polymerase-3 subunit delta'
VAVPSPPAAPAPRPVPRPVPVIDACLLLAEGQPAAAGALRAAVGAPVHAYAFVGPDGSGKAEASRAFAAALLCVEGGCGTCRTCRLTLAGAHPDLRVVERVGRTITVAQAADVVRMAAMAPAEGVRKVIVLEDFHLAEPEVVGRMLKTLEEPIPGTVFVVELTEVPPDLVTIASRCVRVTFGPLPDPVLLAQLGAEGVDAGAAADAVPLAGGNVERARVLALDPGAAARRAAFAAVPTLVDGTGATACRLVDDLMARIDAAADGLKKRHAAEIAALDAQAARLGERGLGRRALKERHERDLRRHRTDELLAGLAAMSRVIRDALAADPTHDAKARLAGLALVDRTAEAVSVFNATPTLALQALLADLPPL